MVDAGIGPGPRRQDRPARSLPVSSQEKVVDRSRRRDLLEMAHRERDGREVEQEADLREVLDGIEVKGRRRVEVVDLPPDEVVGLQVVDRAGQVTSEETNHLRKKRRTRRRGRGRSGAARGFLRSRSCRGCNVFGRSHGPGWSSSGTMAKGLVHRRVGRSRRG